MIARELLVKLGFNIDTVKLDKFNGMVDRVKAKMSSLKENTVNASSPEVVSKMNVLRAYREELKKLSKEERNEVLALNRLEKDAIKEVAAEKRAAAKEAILIKKEEQAIAKVENDEAEEKAKKKKEAFASSFRDIKNVARKMAMYTAVAAGTFGFSLRSTLKDVEDYKTKGKTKNNNSFTPQQISAVDTFNRALDSTKTIVTDLRNAFVIETLPAIKEVLEAFKEWVAINKELIKARLKKLVEGLVAGFTILGSALKRVFGILDMLIGKTAGWENVIATVVTIGAAAWFIGLASSVFMAARAFFTFTVALMTNPVALIIMAIVAALVLLVDEIYVTLKGGDSFINDFLKSKAWEFCKNYINALIDGFKEMWQWVIKVKDGILNFPSNVTTEIKGLYKSGVEKLNNTFNNDKDKLGQGNIKHLPAPRYNVDDMNKNIQSNVINKNLSANIQNKNSVNMVVNLPVGTSAEQGKQMANIAKKEIEKYDRYNAEKAFSAISAH